jgi:hypothetical protein
MNADTTRVRFSDGLARVRRRWFFAVWLELLSLWCLVALAVLACAGTVAVLVRPSGLPLVALAAAAASLLAAALAVLSWKWWRRPTDLQVAWYAEERCPELQERLVSAVGIQDEAPLRPLQQLVLADGARILDELDLDRVVPRRTLARRAAAAAASLAALLAVGALVAPHANRAWQTGRALLFPASVALVVEPGDARVVEGGTVPLRVRIEGVAPDAWSAPVGVVATAPHLRDLPPLALSDGAFAVDLPAGEHSFSYRVVSGALASPEYQVSVRRHPRVDRIAVRYEYPRFSGLAPHVDEDGGDIFAPAGTKVTVRVHTATPVASGAMDLAGQPVRLEPRAPRLLEGQFVLTADAAYRVQLDDGEGLTSLGDTEYFVRVMDDRPPDVRILRPGGDAKVSRLEEVVVEARADDDFGLSRFELVFAPRGGREQVVPLSRAGGTSATGQHTIYLEDLDVRPGDFVTYYARARDVGRGKPSTETRSDIFFLEIRPFNEEFEAAQSQAGMSGGADGQFDDLAQLQKDIIVATWRLDRRQASGAGRSAQDVRAVAKSQAEVKARAAQLAARLAQPAVTRRTRPGQQATPPPVPDPQGGAVSNPMQRAVEAMGQAQAALEQLSTTTALPHENAALNELLRAQAEVRRRQVARQSSSGGRGGRGGNQDLSALFDRELQRQQQTNYEQRATTESREERQEDETLRRLRELAARQDEMNREQRELARRRGQLTEEEVKRRLERLTREQESLQRQAEELARRLQQEQRSAQRQTGQQGQPAPQGQQNPGQQARSGSASPAEGGQGRSGEPSDAERLRDAAGEMAAAARELQRESPGTASERSQRALERLRTATRGVEGDRPDERRRLAGDLQAEARELAEATRRIADQAEAASKAGDRQSVDRLAAQQGRLAERADALEQGAHALADQGREESSRQDRRAGGDAKASAEVLRRAARDLAAERVGERLRRGAEAARNAATAGGNPADAGRQLAVSSRGVSQPLERMASALGQVSGQDAESRRLSEALEQARRLREGLANADRQASSQRPSAGGQPQGQGADGRGDTSQASRPSRSSESGSRGTSGGSGAGSSGEAARAQADFLRQLRQQSELLEALQRENPSLGARMQSMEGWYPSTSAPGTEAWKQDRARWDELKRDITLAIERYEASTAARLAARDARQRLAAGTEDTAPEAWREDVADYFRAISRKARQ